MKVRKLNNDGSEIVSSTNEEIRSSSPSLTDLPTDICLNIVMKMSSKSIITCKCVCKAWKGLLSDPEFVKKYSAQIKTCLLIKDTFYTRISRTLYSIKPEDFHGWHRRCECADKIVKCNRCRLSVGLKEKLKIPMRNFDKMLSSAKGVPNMTFYNKTIKGRKSLIKVKPEDHKYNIANSCNGLLCLIDPLRFDSVAVCNPSTGEFVSYERLKTCDNRNVYSVTCGLGFDTKNDQYKIVRMCTRWTKNPVWGSPLFAHIPWAEVHTIGTCSWRSLKTEVDYLISEWVTVAPPAPISSLKPHSPTYFCGALHWVFADKSNGSNCKVLSFELDEERFHFHRVRISPPCEKDKGHNLVLGVLRNCLCLCDNFGRDRVDIWMMKQYGVWESWTKIFSIDIGDARGSYDGFYQPLFYLDNGALVLFNSPHNELVSYDQLGDLRFKYIKARCRRPDVEIIVHTPNNLISLKDIVKGSPAEGKVLNVNSRCGKLKLVEEENVLLIGWRKF